MESKTYVHKFLADAGCGSRRDMVAAMKAGQVKVNNRTIQDPTYLVDPTTDQIKLGKTIVHSLPPQTFLMLNKPAGYITTNEDPQHRPTVFDLVPKEFQSLRLFAVGRLDEDTTGLLILTNDGQVTFRLTHPKYQHPKEYEVTVTHTLSDRQIRQFHRGMLLEDGRTSPAQITKVEKSQKTTYRIILHEGKKRQVKRMFEHVGNPVLTLTRLRMGQLWIDPMLKPGQARPLTDKEIVLLTGKGR
jgi:23S rRNA pseudouridine2605 synthase